MKRSTYVGIMIPFTVVLICYLYTSLVAFKLGNNILSPLNAFASAAILIFVYFRSNRNKKITLTFLFYALACFVWGIADVIWLILSIMGQNPATSPLTWIFYVIPNCLIVLSMLVFAFTQLSKWNLSQMFTDLIYIGLMSLLFLWIVLLHKDVTILYALLNLDFTSLLSIITDAGIIIGFLSWFFSIRSGSVPVHLQIISLGLVLFALIDMLYYYFTFQGWYVPNSIIDLVYALSLYLLAAGALLKIYNPHSTAGLTIITNVGVRKRWFYLLLYPVLLVFLEISGLINVNLGISDIALFAFLILFYKSSCNYIQVSIENERLLKNEKHNNEILEQRVADQVRELAFLANQDTLTSLFNRRYFTILLADSIETLLNNETLAVFLIDMDRFKNINDTYGHDVGDKVLIELSRRMIEWNRYGAILSRLGGDEFAVVVVGRYTKPELEELCKEIIHDCSKPLKINDANLFITISLGAALYSPEANTNTQLLKNADIAMYRAKSHGYNKYIFYDPFFNETMDKNLEIERLLRQTDCEKDFELFYQPQFSLPDKKLIGAEALLRWRTDEHGYIPPNDFIAVAEQIDYIFEIGKWVMFKTIHQGASWNKKYCRNLKFGFNISPKQLSDESFIEELKTMLGQTDFNTDWIDVEITESMMLNDENDVNAIFSIFNYFGVSVSIDDFGAGYSSMNYLNNFNFNRIKIAKSLIDKVTSDNLSGTQVVKAIIYMAKAIGVQTIAEGVETQEQLDILTALGCDQVQGYLLGRPVPPDLFERSLLLGQQPDI